MSYAIFRVEPINKLKDLRAIGSHNLRSKESYKSNPDIIKSKSKDNIEIITCDKSYYEKYMEMVNPYKLEHEVKQKTERENRKKSFTDMLDDSNSVIADELLFTSDLKFFKDMNKEDITKWANTCMEFIYNDIGYDKSQILNATIHLDEKTPHLHCVVVPLIKKFDKRSNKEKYTISKKHYMKDKLYLSTLQDKYHKRMVDNGYDLDRGIKGSDNEHIAIKEYKKITRKLNLEMTNKTSKLNNAVEELEDKMQTSKTTLLDKEYIKVKKDTFDSMKQVIEETKSIAKMQPKIEKIYKDVDNYSKSYQKILKDNNNLQKEVNNLTYDNDKLRRENFNLKNRLDAILKAIKKFFKHILHFGNKDSKDEAVIEIKDYFDNNDFDDYDIIDIASDTDKEEELYSYADIEYNYSKNDDFEI